MRVTHVTMALVLASVVGLALPRSSVAYRFHAVEWPGGAVPFFNAAPDQAWAVAQAVRAWNESGADVRFVAVPRADAKLVIQEESNRVYCGEGHASLGYVTDAHVVIFPAHGITHACNRYWAAHLVAHELGHVLGLQHEDRYCATMNSSGSMRGGSKCGRSWRWEWRCRLLEPDDVAGVVAAYGGKPRTAPSSPICPLYAAIRRPLGLSASYDSTRRSMTLAFTRPAEPRIPAFVIPVPWKSASAYAMTRPAPACPIAADAADRFHWKMAPRGRERIELAAPTRRLCVAIWAVDRLGRPSATPATIVVAPPAR